MSTASEHRICNQFLTGTEHWEAAKASMENHSDRHILDRLVRNHRCFEDRIICFFCEVQIFAEFVFVVQVSGCIWVWATDGLPRFLTFLKDGDPNCATLWGTLWVLWQADSNKISLIKIIVCRMHLPSTKYLVSDTFRWSMWWFELFIISLPNL